MSFAICHPNSTNLSKLRDNSELQGGTPLVVSWFKIQIIYSSPPQTKDVGLINQFS